MADVPCNGCTACCRAFSIWMQPGDNAALYRTVEVVGRPGQRMLARGADGACVYLTPQGCSIYEGRPRGCRGFDCREWVKKFPSRRARRDAVRRNRDAAPVLTRGTELLQHDAGTSSARVFTPGSLVCEPGAFQGASPEVHLEKRQETMT